MRPISNISTAGTSASPPSPWHSPVPYLFGGLASMLALIALALFILACSYRRLSGPSDSHNQRDGENEGQGHSVSDKQVKVYEEKILVIMAGQVKPTFLATPILTKAGELKVKEEEEMGDDHQQSATITDNRQQQN